jgi:hypothetical protein
MKNITYPFLFLLLFFSACSDGNVKSFHENYNTDNNTDTATLTEVTTTYMHTGFYNVVGDGKGVNMRKEKSDEIYSLSPTPFVSVNDVTKAELERTKLEDGMYTQLCLTFNAFGAQNMKEGTGSRKYAKIAFVIANRLLYVVENKNSIDGGNMCIGLVDYSEKEMQTMLNEVLHYK